MIGNMVSSSAWRLMVILQLLLCIRWSATQNALPLDVIELDVKSFEHQTQAATGQTTGRW
jgi:hypothetical protein